MITEEEKRTIATMVVEEMDARRRKRMEEAPPPAPPKKDRRLCLFTVMDHGVGFPGSDHRAVLERCFYAWATFTETLWAREGPRDVTIVALGDGRPIQSPFRTMLLAGIVSCVQVQDQSMFGGDPDQEKALE
jgi:hypothetical protein